MVHFTGPAAHKLAKAPKRTGAITTDDVAWTRQVIGDTVRTSNGFSAVLCRRQYNPNNVVVDRARMVSGGDGTLRP